MGGGEKIGLVSDSNLSKKIGRKFKYLVRCRKSYQSGFKNLRRQYGLVISANHSGLEEEIVERTLVDVGRVPVMHESGSNSQGEA